MSPDQPVQERTINIMARAMWESDRKAGVLDEGETWEAWEEHYHRLAHDAFFQSLMETIRPEPWMEFGGRIRWFCWRMADICHSLFVWPWHQAGEQWAKFQYRRDFRKQHKIEPTHFDTAGREWASRCSCGWWCRAGARRTVETQEYQHWRAVREGPEGIARQNALIVAGRASDFD